MAPTLRPLFVVLAVAVTSALGCRSAPAPAAGLLPLGPGPEMQVGINGVANLSPSIAAREPFVAIAWTAGVPDGAGDVYVVSSADNGATFSAPLKVGATRVGAEAPVLVVFEWPRLDDQQRFEMPDIRVEWTFREGGRAVQRAARSADQGRTFVSDPEERVHLFYTGVADASALLIGRLFGADEERGTMAHPQVAPQGDGTVVAVWDEADGAGRRVMLRRALLGAAGAVQKIDAFPLSASASAVAPVMGSVQGGVIVAWTSGRSPSSTIGVRRVGLDPLCATGPAPVQLRDERGGHREHD